MNELTVTLPVETLDAALRALTKMPYEFAQPHIDLIRQRASAAISGQQQPQDSATSHGGTD